MSRRVCSQSKSDVGLVRNNNEDRCLTLQDRGLFAVCDGLGGHAAGEIASQIAAEAFQEGLGLGEGEPKDRLKEVLQTANDLIIHDQRVHPERIGMGTTVSLLWVPGSGMEEGWIGHVGDSRVYRLRDESLEQLTEDHSPIYRLYKEGSLGKDDLRHHPQKNLIERSLGLAAHVESDVFPVQIETGDLFLLCTDGLSDCISDDEIAEICRLAPWDRLCQDLVQGALQVGGYDNITVVTIKFFERE